MEGSDFAFISFALFYFAYTIIRKSFVHGFSHLNEIMIFFFLLFIYKMIFPNSFDCGTMWNYKAQNQLLFYEAYEVDFLADDE